MLHQNIWSIVHSGFTLICPVRSNLLDLNPLKVKDLSLFYITLIEWNFISYWSVSTLNIGHYYGSLKSPIKMHPTNLYASFLPYFCLTNLHLYSPCSIPFCLASTPIWSRWKFEISTHFFKALSAIYLLQTGVTTTDTKYRACFESYPTISRVFVSLIQSQNS